MTEEKANIPGAEKPLSVLIISPNPRVHGGVSTFIEAMKVRLTDCKVTSFWIGSLNNEKESRFALGLRLFTAPVRIAWLAARHKFDVVHINPTFNAKSLTRDGLILLGLRIAGCGGVLVYFHGWQKSIEQRVRKNFILRPLLAWLLNGAARVTVLGPDFRQGLEEIGVDSGRVICTRTMFDGAGMNAPENKTAPSGRRMILFMSRFESEKGVHELLNAFARLAGEFPDIDLVMAGDGEEKTSLLAAAAKYNLGNRISFPGYVTGAEKWRMLHQCAIFALPTYLKGEGMPVALLEAMGAGKPVLAGPAGSIRTIISDPDNGVYLPVVNVDTVEAGLRRLLSDPQLCEKIGRHNIDYAWRRFEADVVTAEIEAIYRDIASNNRT